MNRSFLKSLLMWIEKSSLQHPVKLPIFITQYHTALYQAQPFLFFLASPFFIQIASLLKQYGYIQDWCLVEKHLLTNLTSKRIIADILIIWLKPWVDVGAKKILLQLPAKKKKQLFLTYSQVRYLTSVSKSIYIFNTPDGLLGHHTLLKKKIGGNLVCIFK